MLLLKYEPAETNLNLSEWLHATCANKDASVASF